MSSRTLPAESTMGRTDALDAFLAVVNAVEPNHPYIDDPYPLDRDEVEFGSTRSIYARCGPHRSGPQVVIYKTRMTYIRTISRARHLALLTHEISHIPQPRHRWDSTHPPSFWATMARHAEAVTAALADGRLRTAFPEVDIDDYHSEVVMDPNAYTVDRRSLTVRDCQTLLEALLLDNDTDLPAAIDDWDLVPPIAKTINYRSHTRDRPKTKELTDLPGIGRRAAAQIAGEYEWVDEMVHGTKLDAGLRKAAQTRYHDQLWANLQTYCYSHLPEQDDYEEPSDPNHILRYHRPDSDFFLEEGERTLPADAAVLDHMRDVGPIGIGPLFE